MGSLPYPGATIVRWVLMVPAAFAAAYLSTVIVHNFGHVLFCPVYDLFQDRWIHEYLDAKAGKLLDPFVLPVAYMVTGVLVAPNRRRMATNLLALLLVLAWCINLYFLLTDGIALEDGDTLWWQLCLEMLSLAVLLLIWRLLYVDPTESASEHKARKTKEIEKRLEDLVGASELMRKMNLGLASQGEIEHIRAQLKERAVDEKQENTTED